MNSSITTHVLDTALGKPAGGISVALEVQQTDGVWSERGRGVTDSDGRIAELFPGDSQLALGTYRLTFFVADYFRGMSMVSFYPKISIEFSITDTKHYHVPLLLSPFGYSTYRGS